MRKERNFRVNPEDPESLVSAIEQITAAINEITAESEAWRLVALSLVAVFADRSAPFLERAAIPACFSALETLASSMSPQNAAVIREVCGSLMGAWDGSPAPAEGPARPLLRLVQNCDMPPEG